jgi:putative oxidoreductase
MKKFSQQAAANVVPLLARILLFLAFVPTGWHHAMEQSVFSGDQAIRLRELGIASTSASAYLDGTQGVSLQETPPLPAEAGGMAFQTRSLHELTLVFDGLRLPRPQAWAWTVTVFELIGGSLLVVGLLSRVWAGGIALWAVALLFLSNASIGASFMAIWSPTDANSVFLRTLALSQLALIVIALGITLTGPGKLSVDGLIFKGRGGDDGGDE